VLLLCWYCCLLPNFNLLPILPTAPALRIGPRATWDESY
jgi:hypothetical protein